MNNETKKVATIGTAKQEQFQAGNYDEAYLQQQLLENNFRLIDLQFREFPKGDQGNSIDMIFIAQKIQAEN